MANPRPPTVHEPVDPITPEREMLAKGSEPIHKRSIMSDTDDALQLDLYPLDAPEEEIPGQDDVLRAGDPDLDPMSTEYSGEESPGGSASSPDGNDVDAIGQLFGVTGADVGMRGLVLGGDLIEPRDRNRWENNPDSKDQPR